MYEIFSKSIGLYNGAEYIFTKSSWPNILKTYHRPPVDNPATTKTNESVSNKDGNCFSCQYSINIKNKRYGLPYRTYIWRGAQDTVIPANPTAIPPTLETTVEGWCFKYGEKEWLEKKTYKATKTNALGNAALEIDPIGRIDCTTGVSLP